MGWLLPMEWSFLWPGTQVTNMKALPLSTAQQGLMPGRIGL